MLNKEILCSMMLAQQKNKSGKHYHLKPSKTKMLSMKISSVNKRNVSVFVTVWNGNHKEDIILPIPLWVMEFMVSLRKTMKHARIIPTPATQKRFRCNDKYVGIDNQGPFFIPDNPERATKMLNKKKAH